MNNNPFKEFQERQVSKCLERIIEELLLLSKKNLKFDVIHQLIQEVSKKTNISESTLYRNKDYRRALEAFLESNGGSNKYQLRRKMPDTQIMTLKTEISNLKEKNISLSLQVTKYKNLYHDHRLNSSDPEGDLNFFKTANALEILLTAASDFFALEDEQVIDLTKFGSQDSNVLINRDLLSPFLKWLYRHED